MFEVPQLAASEPGCESLRQALLLPLNCYNNPRTPAVREASEFFPLNTNCMLSLCLRDPASGTQNQSIGKKEPVTAAEIGPYCLSFLGPFWTQCPAHGDHTEISKGRSQAICAGWQGECKTLFLPPDPSWEDSGTTHATVCETRGDPQHGPHPWFSLRS